MSDCHNNWKAMTLVESFNLIPNKTRFGLRIREKLWFQVCVMSLPVVVNLINSMR